MSDSEDPQPHGTLAASEEPRQVLRIDQAVLRSSGYLPTRDRERLLSNQFRHIKRTLIGNALGRGAQAVPRGHLIMVTSALPGEGKTFCTINLALSLAREKGVEVVVIDVDPVKQSFSSVFGIERERGLLDLLLDSSEVADDLILRTDIEGLHILPSGRNDEDMATELLASPRMQAVVADICAGRPDRIVLFDSAPLLLTNEARVLSGVVGQLVLIIKSDATPQDAVAEAISYVHEDTVIGLVLNQSAVGSPGKTYGYGAYSYAEYGSATRGKDAP